MKKNSKKLFSRLIFSALMLFIVSMSVFCMSEVHQVSEQPVSLKANISLTKGNQIISMSLRDSDVKQVLRMLADKAGLNIIFHSSVMGKTTLDLVNITLNDAFKMVLQANELSYVVDGKTIIIMSNAASSALNIAKQNINVIPVKYVDAAPVADFLNANIFGINNPGLSNDKIVVVNPVKNELMVFGTKNDYDMAKKIVTMLDVKPQTTVFKINHTNPKDIAGLVCSSIFGQEVTQSVETPNQVQAVPTSSQGGSNSKSSSATATNVDLKASVVACKVKSLPRYSKEMTSSTSKTEVAPSAPAVEGGQGNTAEIKSSSASSGLQSLNTSAVTVLYADRLGTVTLIGGTQQQLDMVSQFIKDNDKKAPQALIELSVLELSEDGSKDFQTSYQFAHKKWGIGFNTFSQENGISVGSLTNPIGGTSLDVALQYIIKNSKGRVLANPKIIATNGQASVIDLTSDYVKSVKTEFSQQTIGLTSTPIVTRTYEIEEDSGMKISLVPFISPDGYVSLNIIPDYATIKDEIKMYPYSGATEKDLVATLLQRRNLDLKNIRIKDGETLVLGGLINEEEKMETAKIPFLGDIPGIGVLFRNSSKTKVKNELVILITPRIIQDTEDLVNNDVKSEKL